MKERLKSLNGALLTLEKDAQAKEVLKEALRQAHTLKGSAKMLGLNDIAQVSHGMEDILVAVQQGDRPLPPQTFDLLFRVVDVLSARVEQLTGGEKEPMDVSALCLELDHLRGSVAHSAGEDLPVAEAPTTSPGEPSSAPREGKAPGPEPRRPAGSAQVKPSLRVSVDKIDHLANLATEMTIQNLRVSERHLQAQRLLRRLRHFRHGQGDSAQRRGSGVPGLWPEGVEDPESARRELRQLWENLAGDQVRLNLITEELRQSVLDLTMLPLSTVFDAFPRTVRDLAREFGREVDLTVRGGEAELDKKIIEAVGDPLVHLLRNAIAHGIEPPETRERAGKCRRGQLLLDAAP